MNHNTDIDWKLLISNAMDNLSAEGYSKKLYRRGFELDLSSDLLDEILELLPEGYDAAQEYKNCDLVVVNMATEEIVVVIECKCQIFFEKKQIEAQLKDLKKREGIADNFYTVMWSTFVNRLPTDPSFIPPKYFGSSKKGIEQGITPNLVTKCIELFVGEIAHNVFYDDPRSYRGYNISILGSLVNALESQRTFDQYCAILHDLMNQTSSIKDVVKDSVNLAVELAIKHAHFPYEIDTQESSSIVSDDAIRAITAGRSGDLVGEYVVPVMIVSELVNRQRGCLADIKKTILKFSTIAVITKSEKRLLRKLGLFNKMPTDWDGVSEMARYDLAGIKWRNITYKEVLKGN